MQAGDSEADPAHVAPEPDGEGLLQTRVRV